MVSTQLQSILNEFEPFFNCPLVSDERESCLVKMSVGIDIHIELTPQGLVLIACRLGEAAGKYRDQMFKAAMKSNYLFPPHTGTFGYSQKSKNIIIFMLVDPKNIKPEKIREFMPPFVEKAKLWSNAIKSGSVPLIADSKKTASDNLFGLKR